MPFEVVFPRLGWNMETGTLVEWKKQEGDKVQEGDILFIAGGDKAEQEVEALESGTLHILPGTPAPGIEMPVGTVLGYLLKPGEVAPEAGGGQPAQALAAPIAEALASPATTAAPAAPGGASGAVVVTPSGRRPNSTPRARRVAGELGVDWRRLQGTGRAGRIRERDVRAVAAAQPTALMPVGGAAAASRVSPLARRVAQELGVDVDALAAQMPGRWIEREDVEAAARGRAVAPAAPPSVPAQPVPPTPEPRAPSELPGVMLPITTVRRTIADRMAASAQTTAPVTLTTEADATELVRLREQFKSDTSQPAPSYTDLLARLAGQALVEHPAVNARFEGDGILQAAAVNIGLAVDTDRGLLVPVLRDVQTKTVRQIAREAAALIERTRAGRIGPDDLRGGTFTITNLGMFEIDAFTPIINLPECAILGVGRIVPKQVVVDVAAERVAIRHMVFLSLTFDHRLVDGAPAARFLQRIKQYVEKPYLWVER
jgi:pyruvate dehydrogenase E2 component (dihydrolipoamide acetyltransferase)